MVTNKEIMDEVLNLRREIYELRMELLTRIPHPVRTPPEKKLYHHGTSHQDLSAKYQIANPAHDAADFMGQ